MVAWVHLSQDPEWHHDRFSRFSRVHGRDRPTDPATSSVAIVRIKLVLRCGLIMFKFIRLRTFCINVSLAKANCIVLYELAYRRVEPRPKLPRTEY